MSDAAIRAEGLSKLYTLGEMERYSALRDKLARTLRAPWTLLKREKLETFWALRDVSLEVKHGEVLGLIGRNGAGKTTLLKILSRITRPTKGWAEIYGRVGSLLEVGTGFHPELSGRDNIYLSGAILGMRKWEIARKFDEIVAFAEIEKFLDTQVKHYSSGMYVRLAFAVAAHLEPEILFVDEVLAVGDSRFQKKCLGKMDEVAHQGRTVLFVSHNAAAVTRLCNRCLLLNRGNVVEVGPTYDVMNAYLRSDLANGASREWSEQEAPGDKVVRLRAVRVRSISGLVSEAFDIRDEVGIEMVYDVLEDGQVLWPNVHLFNEEGTNLFVTIDTDEHWRRRPRPRGRYTSTAWIPGNFLAEGTFIVRTAITTFLPMVVRLDVSDVAVFQVIDSLDGNSVRFDYAGHLPGVVRPFLNWRTNYLPHNSSGVPQKVTDELSHLDAGGTSSTWDRNG
jgi:lipopolysaccharide transport system ATP-binding protein